METPIPHGIECLDHETAALLAKREIERLGQHMEWLMRSIQRPKSTDIVLDARHCPACRLSLEQKEGATTLQCPQCFSTSRCSMRASSQAV
jgi:predicted RNA-binding Zn-ribbon protein involved in translation (DUF1610 family)